MAKSPIEYFESQDFISQAATPDITPAERIFMQKYLGVQNDEVLKSMPETEADPEVRVVDSTIVEMAKALGLDSEQAEDASIDSMLREVTQIQFVGFSMGSQLYTIPTLVVQEVIRTMAPSKLPMTSNLVAGIINLRGKVTPIVRLRDLLDLPVNVENGDRFTIICRCSGLQLGLQIDAVSSMYRVEQEDIQWNLDTQMAQSDCVTGLFKLNGKLIPIVSVERIVAIMLQ